MIMMKKYTLALATMILCNVTATHLNAADTSSLSFSLEGIKNTSKATFQQTSYADLYAQSLDCQNEAIVQLLQGAEFSCEGDAKKGLAVTELGQRSSLVMLGQLRRKIKVTLECCPLKITIEFRRGRMESDDNFGSNVTASYSSKIVEEALKNTARSAETITECRDKLLTIEAEARAADAATLEAAAKDNC